MNESNIAAGGCVQNPFGKLGEGPPPPRAPSAARAAIRQFLIDDVFGGADVALDGSAGLIADMISYALERRAQAKLYEITALLVDVDNLLELVAGEAPSRWETITLSAIDVAPPYTAVGYMVGDTHALSVAVTGREHDPAAEDIAQFIESMPGLLSAIKTCLSEPL